LSEIGGEGTGIVMTDLFISATAALLLCLAVSRTTPDIPLPVQADLIALCPTPNSPDGTPYIVALASDPAGISAKVGSPEDLAAVPRLLGLPPALFRTIAVMATSASPVSATCVRRLTEDIVKPHNDQLATEPAAAGSSRAVFAVGPVLPATAQGS